jgi:hypothetical protein
MIKEEIKVIVLIPREGFKLTQAKDVPLEQRVFSEKVFLAVNDSPDNWMEIADEEAQVIIKQQEELNKNEEL